MLVHLGVLVAISFGSDFDNNNILKKVPHDVIKLIFTHFEPAYILPERATLSLVCKAWNEVVMGILDPVEEFDAFVEYSKLRISKDMEAVDRNAASLNLRDGPFLGTPRNVEIGMRATALSKMFIKGYSNIQLMI